jgi:hypothetical protein
LNQYLISYWERGFKRRVFVAGGEVAESVTFFLREVSPEAKIVSVWTMIEIPKAIYERQS